MHTGDTSEQSTYWKRPWGKWMTLLAAAVFLVCMGLNLSEYFRISEVKDVIFSEKAFEKWRVETLFRCSVYGFATALYLGQFFIGSFSRSKKTAQRAEGLLLLGVGLLWLGIGCVLDFPALGHRGMFWGLLALCAVVAGIYTVWKSRRVERG